MIAHGMTAPLVVPRRKKFPKLISACPTESQEMEALATWLDARGVVWFHPFNEGRRTVHRGAQLKRIGLKAGVPDVIIMSKLPKYPSIRGVAVELKRTHGSTTSQEQHAWLQAMTACGWMTFVAKGAKSAIEFLSGLGF